MLTGTGGIADHIDELLGVMNKETGATIISDPHPVHLVDRLTRAYEEKILPRYISLLKGHDPDGELEGSRPPS